VLGLKSTAAGRGRVVNNLEVPGSSIGPRQALLRSSLFSSDLPGKFRHYVLSLATSFPSMKFPVDHLTIILPLDAI
jgi:hypothetical protein